MSPRASDDVPVDQCELRRLVLIGIGDAFDGEAVCRLHHHRVHLRKRKGDVIFLVEDLRDQLVRPPRRRRRDRDGKFVNQTVIADRR